MKVKIVNEDILDEKELTIYVQRFICPQRTYQVHRKPTSEDEEFIVSEEADNTDERLWCVSTELTAAYDPDLEDEGLFEIFADIYLDEKNPPVDSLEDCKMNAGPYAHIVYDTTMQLYRWEPLYHGWYELKTVAASTLQETIEKGIPILDKLISRSLAHSNKRSE